MNARLMELIDVSTIETMAEQFYQLTNISHQLLDAEKECIFSFGINEKKICKLPKIEIPFFIQSIFRIFCCMVSEKRNFQLPKIL